MGSLLADSLGCSLHYSSGHSLALCLALFPAYEALVSAPASTMVVEIPLAFQLTSAFVMRGIQAVTVKSNIRVLPFLLLTKVSFRVVKIPGTIFVFYRAAYNHLDSSVLRIVLARQWIWFSKTSLRSEFILSVMECSSAVGKKRKWMNKHGYL